VEKTTPPYLRWVMTYTLAIRIVLGCSGCERKNCKSSEEKNLIVHHEAMFEVIIDEYVFVKIKAT
jgi:hypothetical protein